MNTDEAVVVLAPVATPSKADLPGLIEAYRKRKLERDIIDVDLEGLREIILPLVEAYGDWKDEQGYARMVAANITISYDAKALDALCKSISDLEAILYPHRRTTAKAAYLQIR